MSNNSRESGKERPPINLDRTDANASLAPALEMEIDVKRQIFLFAVVILLVVATTYAQDSSSVPKATRHKYSSINLTTEQILRYLEADFKFGPPRPKPNGLVVLEAMNEPSKTMLMIEKDGENIVLTSLYFQPARRYDDASSKQIIRRTGILIRFLKNTAPEVSWDGPEESAAIGKMIGDLSRQPGQYKREVGARTVVFRRAALEQPLIEVHVHAKELGNQ